MSFHNNYLRKHRKQSSLSLSDVAFLMGEHRVNNLSRYELRETVPSLKALMAYHILFDTNLEDIFKEQKVEMKQRMKERITILLSAIKLRESTPKVEHRIARLQSILDKLHSTGI